MKVLVFGSVAMDSIVVPTGEEEAVVGGSAFYFAHAARLLSSVGIVSVVGEDFPKEELDALDALDVDRTGLVIAPGRTFAWRGRYMDDMNVRETLSTELNVLERYTPHVPEGLKRAKIVFLANMGPDQQLAVLEQVSRPWFVACDSMNLWIRGQKDALLELLKRVDLFFVNDEEARMLTGERHLLAAGKSLLAMGPTWVAVKRGEYGCLLIGGKKVCVMPAFPLDAVKDPTGAGDSFAGGAMGYLAWRRSKSEDALRSAMAMGTVMASFTVEDFGARRLKGLTRKELAERAASFVKMTGFALDWFAIEREGVDA